MGILIYIIPLLLCFYVLYLLRYCIYSTYGNNKGHKIKYPLYLYIFSFILSFMPIVNFAVIICFIIYISVNNDEIEVKNKLFTEF